MPITYLIAHIGARGGASNAHEKHGSEREKAARIVKRLTYQHS